MNFFDLKTINAEYTDELKQAASEVIDSGRYIRGERVVKFENELCNYIGCKYTVGTGNGLDALRLIFRAYIELGVMKPGDEVILPANTFIATMIAVTDNGLKPVITDIDPHTMNLDISKAEKAITEKTKAIIPVHLYGNCCWNEQLKNIAISHNIKIVEDNAQAIGAKAETAGLNGGFMSGNLGNAAATSFYPIKNLGALGDAGAVTTNDISLAQTVRALGNYGEMQKYRHKYIGINSRLDEIQAAFLSVKLKYLERENTLRAAIAQTYNANILVRQITKPELHVNRQSVWHQYIIRTENRDELKNHLAENGIETMIHYPTPLHKHEAYLKYENLSFPTA
ncbi:MAG: DegT/DnrJ/EryC1/StrS family aminotransferase, partial [Bacteroidales bacterium]